MWHYWISHKRHPFFSHVRIHVTEDLNLANGDVQILISGSGFPRSLARVAAIIKTSVICSADRFRLAVLPRVCNCWNHLIIRFWPPRKRVICSRLLYSEEMALNTGSTWGRGGGGFRKLNTSDECGRRDTTVRPANHQFPVVGGGESEFWKCAHGAEIRWGNDRRRSR